jgi:hypothetical protein
VAKLQETLHRSVFAIGAVQHWKGDVDLPQVPARGSDPVSPAD